MRNLLKRIPTTFTRSPRRRKHRAGGSMWNLETVESRLFLSAVTGVIADESLIVGEVANETNETVEFSPLQYASELRPSGALLPMLPQNADIDFENASSAPGPHLPEGLNSRPVLDFSSDTSLRDPAHPQLPSDGSIPTRPAAEFKDRRRHPAMDFINADTAEDSTPTSDTTLDPQQAIQASEELPVESNLSANTAVDHFWMSTFDGFIDIPRPSAGSETPSTAPNDLRFRSGLDSVGTSPERMDNSHGTVTDKNAGDDDVTAAAIAFFNRQTAGGFVDSALVDLHGPAGEQAVIAALGSVGLEGSIGRLNPFDDGRYAAILTTIEFQTDGDSHTGRGIDDSTTPDLTMAGLAFGLVGVRSHTFRRLCDGFRRLMNRLTTLMAGTER